MRGIFGLWWLAIALVGAGPLRAQDQPSDLPAAAPPESSVTAEQAMVRYRATTDTAPRRCSDVDTGDVIVVCGNRDYDATQRLPFLRVAGVGSPAGPVRGEAPRAADLSTDGAGSCGIHGDISGCALDSILASADGDASPRIVKWIALATGLVAEPIPTADYERQDLED